MTTDTQIQVLTVRMPNELHEQLRRKAFETRTSINRLIVEAVNRFLKEEK